MGKSHVSRFQSARFQEDILRWYAQNHRILPWRVTGAKKTDPYKVWLSEIMLQQTTVPAVIPYFEAFLKRWPSVKDLAKADDNEVMTAWAGLGYYARARNLLKCARVVSDDFNGKFPSDRDRLIELPGIGPYTAAAITSIAFGRAATVVDGNIERIVARIFAIAEPYPQGKKQIHEKAHQIFEGIENLDSQSIKSYPQALMDIGSDICTPRSPKCRLCPVQTQCAANFLKTPDAFPVRAIKKPVPTRKGAVYWIQDKAGNILVEKRSDKRMLGGMMGLVTTDWDLNGGDHLSQQSISKKIRGRITELGVIHHVFTHFRLELTVYGVSVPKIQNMLELFPESSVCHLNDVSLKDIGLPSVFLKAGLLAQKVFKKVDEHDEF